MRRAHDWHRSELVQWIFKDDDREEYEYVRRPFHRDLVVGAAVIAQR